AAYRASPKRLRAELHERFADRLEEREIADLDEFAGYHLEQAYLLRSDLGEADRHTATLAEDAGRRLGGAGNRARKRNGEFATARLLTRAASLLPPTDGARLDMLCELAIAFLHLGDPERARATAEEAAAAAAVANDRRRELRARLEIGVVQL